jgi:hypothetical protein
MTYDGAEPAMGDTVAVGPKEVGGPAGVPDAGPAPHHHPAFLAARSGRTGPGHRQRRDGASPHPAPWSRITRALAGARAKEVAMA